jgi:hypothetical protein
VNAALPYANSRFIKEIILMTRGIRSFFMAICGTAAIALMLCMDTTSAGAQPIGWNPPCAMTKVVNATPCVITMVVRTSVGPITVTVNPGATAPFVVPAGTLVGGVFTQAGTFVPLMVPGGVIPSPPNPVAGVVAAGSVFGVTLGPAPGCCVDIHFDNSTAPGCYIWVVPAPAPCIP